jgi:hypothetical protein
LKSGHSTKATVLKLSLAVASLAISLLGAEAIFRTGIGLGIEWFRQPYNYANEHKADLLSGLSLRVP